MSILLIVAGSVLYTYFKSRPRLSPAADASTTTPAALAAAERAQDESKMLLSPSDMEKGIAVPRRRSSSPGPEGKERSD